MYYRYLCLAILLFLLSDCRKSDVPAQNYWTVNSTRYYPKNIQFNSENAILADVNDSTLIAITFRDTFKVEAYRVLTTGPYDSLLTTFNNCWILIGINGNPATNYWSLGVAGDSVYVSKVNGRMQASFTNISLVSPQGDTIHSSGILALNN